MTIGYTTQLFNWSREVALGKKKLWPDSAPIPAEQLQWKSSHTPITYTLIAISVALHVGGTIHPEAFRFGVLYGPWVARGDWWRLFTTLVTHGGLLHLFFNLSVVWTIGRPLETILGSTRFVAITVLSGLGSGLFVLIFNFDVRTVGMSGAILGWLGALLPIARPAGRRQLLVMLLQVTIISLLPGVSWPGHLGGFMTGLTLGTSLRSGGKIFSWALPVTAFAIAVLSYLAGSGRFH